VEPLILAKLEKKVQKLISEGSTRFPSLSDEYFLAFCRPVFVPLCGAAALAESNSNHSGVRTLGTFQPILQDSRDDLVLYFHVLASAASIGMVEKYNYTLSAALTTGVAVSGHVMFFALGYNPKNLKWWGNTVSILESMDPVLAPFQFRQEDTLVL
jgi:hypothetical protein